MLCSHAEGQLKVPLYPHTVWEIDKAFRIHLLSLFFINVGDLSALLTKLHAWHITVK